MSAPDAALLHAHIAARSLLLGHLLATAHGRLSAWFGGADRIAADAAVRTAQDQILEGHVACLMARRDWLVSFHEALVANGAEQAMIAAAECVWANERGGGTPWQAAVSRARADEARKASRADEAPLWAALMANKQQQGGGDAA